MTKNILVAVITAVIVGGVAYYSTNQAAVSDKAALEAKVADLEAQVAELKKETNAETPPPNSESTDSTFKFTELGIELTIPSSVKDLTYTTASGKIQSGQAYTSANVSTKSLVTLDKGCSTALGSLSKVSGQYPSSPTPENSIRTLVKQFPAFYISYTHHQSTCSSDNSIEAKAGSFRETFRNAFSTITELK